MKNKIFVVILIFVLVLSLTACESNNTKDKPTIVCIEYFAYDWVRNILGSSFDNYDVILLNQSGKDMHSFEPSADDMIKMLKADYLIYLGGISEAWVDDFLSDKDCIYVCLMDEFIESDVFNNYDIDMNDIDEHIYLSPVISSELVKKLGEKLASRFNDDKLIDNANSYAEKVLLQIMDKEIGDYPIVVCDRFPFDYLSKDLGFKSYAAFDGCSAETEASFSIILELSDAIKDNNLDRVYIIENSDASIAEQVISTANLKDIDIIELNSLQSVTDMNLSYLDTLNDLVEKICNGTIKG